MGNDGLFISESQPIEDSGKFTWLQILTDGTRKWYERSNGGWALVKIEPGGLTGEFEGTFKKIKIENGIVTEFEIE